MCKETKPKAKATAKVKVKDEPKAKRKEAKPKAKAIARVKVTDEPGAKAEAQASCHQELSTATRLHMAGLHLLWQDEVPLSSEHFWEVTSAPVDVDGRSTEKAFISSHFSKQ